MICDKCAGKCECGLAEALSTLLDYIDNLRVESEIKDIVSDYVETCEYFEN